MIIGADDISPAFPGDVDAHLRNFDTQHLLQAQGLRDHLSNGRKEIPSPSTALVLDWHDMTVRVPFNRVRHAVKAKSMADQRHSVMHDHSTPMIRSASVDPLMPSRPLHGEMVIRPYSVLE